ncbi:DUF3221 domain-containing protein [Bacillus marinisedimentorum]|uniref:DUF3221 domain-containing protein n=1 Tax=Bacillus marinisedimentorum TaxID=1821260 RepID=UPI000871C122|nr:DUF3221 domain-containing protein [Bacillus marinisedimentorum]
MKKSVLVLLTLAAAGLAAYLFFDMNKHNEKVTDPDITGYIMQIEGKQALVVGKNEDFYNAAWITIPAFKKVSPGEYVKVKFTGPVNESFPLQADEVNIETAKAEKPSGASITQEEALRSVLKEVGKKELLGVHNIEYLPDFAQWSVVLQPIAASSQEAGQMEFLIDDSTGKD